MSEMQDMPEGLAFGRGDRLRKARELQGWNQIELAKRLGISKNTVGSYEAGHAPKKAYLTTWAWETKVPVKWLETGVWPSDGKGPDGQVTHQPGAAKVSRHLVALAA